MIVALRETTGTWLRSYCDYSQTSGSDLCMISSLYALCKLYLLHSGEITDVSQLLRHSR